MAAKAYRPMRGDNGRPQLGESASTLGVRVPTDIAQDAHGNVSPDGNHGMSVRPSIDALLEEAAAFVPKRYKEKDPLRFRNAAGSNSLIVFRIGKGSFCRAPIGEKLTLSPDRPNHGVIEPARTMSLADYKAAIADTQTDWVPDEP